MDGSGQELLNALMAKVDRLSEVCARLGEENAELRAQVSRLSAGPAPARAARPAPAGAAAADGALARKVSRRTMGKALGAVAATAVGAGALIDTARPAAAANGSAVMAGNITTGESRTSVLYDGNANFQGVVLLGNDSTYDGGANFPAGVGGWAGAGSTAGKGGVQNGVYGYTDNGAGNGVVGYNSGFVAGSGAGVLGLAFTAANAAVQGTNTSGTGVSGSGTVGVSATGSTTGLSASGPTAVSAASSGATGVAVAASSASSTTAVKAANTGTGAAVNANNAGPGACVQATSTNGRGGSFSGKAAQVQLVPGTAATHPTSGKAGDLYVDKTSRLWFCKTGGTTATWVKIV